MSAPNRSTLSQTIQTHAAGDDRINAAAVDARAAVSPEDRPMNDTEDLFTLLERVAGVLERIADAGRPSHIVAADKHEKQGGVRYSVKDKPAPGSCTAPTAGTGSNRAP